MAVVESTEKPANAELTGKRPPSPLLGELPIIVGITGHRDLRSADIPALEKAVGQVFDELRAAYKTTPLLVLTPLAEGADRLVARVAAARGIAYRVPLPMPADAYREDFDPDSKRDFDELLRRADGFYVMPFLPGNAAHNIAEPQRRAEQYALVGGHLARASHVLIALWNGEESPAVGGTAQIVRFRCCGAPKQYLARASVLDAPETGPVVHLYAPRSCDSEIARIPGSRQILTRDGPLPPGAPDPLEPVFRRIETFNQDCLLIGANRKFSSSATERLMYAAEAVAAHYQKQTHGALRRLFVATGIAACILAFYSNFDSWGPVVLLPYALALLVARIVYRRAREGGWQERCQDYRALEMGLNIQRVWEIAGVGKSVADYYIRRQRSELDWIRDAIRSVYNIDRRNVYDDGEGLAAIRNYLVSQRDYFAKASIREESHHVRLETLSQRLLLAGFLFSGLLATLIVASFLPHATYVHQLIEPYQATLRSVLIFLIAAVTIAAALLHDYSQQRALHQHARRYTVMRDICQRALSAVEESVTETGQSRAPDIGIAREIIFEIGREVLIENGDWVLLHRELPIEPLRV